MNTHTTKLIAKGLLYGGAATLIFALFAIATPADAQTYAYTYNATLNGANEVPPVTDADTTGSATFQVESNYTGIDYTLNVSSDEPVTSAHLHCAMPGESGEIAAPLNVTGYVATGTMMHVTGTIEESDITENCPGITSIGTLANAMHDGKVYVNVHSAEYPDGLARGQLALVSTTVPVGTATPPVYVPPTTTPPVVIITPPPTTPPAQQPTPEEIDATIHDLMSQLRDIQHQLIQLLVQVRLRY